MIRIYPVISSLRSWKRWFCFVFVGINCAARYVYSFETAKRCSVKDNDKDIKTHFPLLTMAIFEKNYSEKKNEPGILSWCSTTWVRKQSAQTSSFFEDAYQSNLLQKGMFCVRQLHDIAELFLLYFFFFFFFRVSPLMWNLPGSPTWSHRARSMRNWSGRYKVWHNSCSKSSNSEPVSLVNWWNCSANGMRKSAICMHKLR